MKSLKTLREKYSKLKKNKANTKSLMIELMEISSADFDIDRMHHKLYKCGFSQHGKPLYKWLDELCEEMKCIFCGWRPEKVNGLIVGGMPVYGLIAVKE